MFLLSFINTSAIYHVPDSGGWERIFWGKVHLKPQILMFIYRRELGLWTFTDHIEKFSHVYLEELCISST